AAGVNLIDWGSSFSHRKSPSQVKKLSHEDTKEPSFTKSFSSFFVPPLRLCVFVAIFDTSAVTQPRSHKEAKLHKVLLFFVQPWSLCVFAALFYFFPSILRFDLRLAACHEVAQRFIRRRVERRCHIVGQQLAVLLMRALLRILRAFGLPLF